MHINDVEFIMVQYGLWVFQCDGTPRCGSVMLQIMKSCEENKKRFASTVAAISDDLALQVDGYLAALKETDPEVVEGLLQYFVYGGAYRDVANRMGLSYADARMLVRAGLSAICACFRMHERMAA